MKRIVRIAIAGAVVLVFAGCGQQAGDPTGTPPTPGSSTTGQAEPTPTPEPTGASVAQWASEIAPLKADWQKLEDSWKDATCSTGAAADPSGTDCQAYLVAMGFTADSISVMTGGMAKPGSPTSLGEPPAEIAGLHAETVDAAESASLAGEAVECPGEQCRASSFAFLRAWSNLGSQLESWSPYL